MTAICYVERSARARKGILISFDEHVPLGVCLCFTRGTSGNEAHMACAAWILRTLPVRHEVQL